MCRTFGADLRRHFDFAPDLPDFRGGAFPRELQIPVETSNRERYDRKLIADFSYTINTQIYIQTIMNMT